MNPSMTATEIWQELWSREITEDKLREALAQLDDAPTSLSVQGMRAQMLAQLARWDADRGHEARAALDAMSALLDDASPSERLPACIHGFDEALSLDDIPLSESSSSWRGNRHPAMIARRLRFTTTTIWAATYGIVESSGRR